MAGRRTASWTGEEGLLVPDPFTGVDWPVVFGREAPLVVEIGFGKDTFLLDLAERNRDVDHVGIEYSRRRAVAFVRKAERRRLANVRATRVHAAYVLARLLPEAGVREVYLLFPDPWPKQRHAKNRLVQPPFARCVHRVLEPRGTLTMATDDPNYRDQMLEVVEGHGGFSNDLGSGGWQEPADPADPADPAESSGTQTIFEERWRRRGRSIHYLRFTASA